jgi:Xaa-Pro aminopeptidase
LLPYRENPENLKIKEDDVIFFDFGPVFEEWEADFGRTYVLGNDPLKLKLQRDIELAWLEGKAFYEKHKSEITGADFYAFTKRLAEKYGWEYGNEHCGHLIGNFPHEQIIGEETINYIHPDNHQKMSDKDKHGNDRYWIYEIHFVDRKAEIGGFYEQLVS